MVKKYGNEVKKFCQHFHSQNIIMHFFRQGYVVIS